MSGKCRFFLPVLAVLFSCTALEKPSAVQPAGELVPMSFAVSAAPSKVYLDGLDAVWEVDDEVAVFDDVRPDDIHVFKVVEAEGSSAVIRGEVWQGATAFMGVTPASAAVSSRQGSLTVRVPSGQTVPSSGGADPSALVAVAASAGGPLVFHNAVALVKVQVDLAGIREIRLVGKDHPLLSGTLTADPSAGTRTDLSDGASQIRLRCADGAFPQGSTVCLAVAPATLSGVRLGLFREPGLLVREGNSSLVLDAGDLRSLGKASAATQPEGASYVNPVIPYNCADPSLFDDRERTGYFYALSTRNDDTGAPSSGVRLPIYRSRNLVSWEFVGNAFGPSQSANPTWADSQGGGALRVWAPDLRYIDGRYVLYYALGSTSYPEYGVSGVAVSDSPTGPFEDKGCIVSKETTGVFNCIDPCFFEDTDGKRYLLWGSYNSEARNTGNLPFGIHIARLSGDALSIDPSTIRSIAGSSWNMEAAMLVKRGSYYYLFVSMGASGFGGTDKSSWDVYAKDITYRVIVGRATSVTGPYYSGTGFFTPSLNASSGYSYLNTVMVKDGDAPEFAGPGHNSGIVTDDIGQDWMLMHARWQKTTQRPAILEKVEWVNNWPVFTGNNGHPTLLGDGPVFFDAPSWSHFSHSGLEDIENIEYEW